MRVLLLSPPALSDRLHQEDIRAVPIGLYYIGSLLKAHGHAVEVHGLEGMRGRESAIRGLLAEKKPQVIGFSVFNANRWGAIEIAGMAKALDPKVTTVFGGVGATFLWRHILSHFEAVDYCVLGEGEYPFLHLIGWLESGARGSPAHIAGLAFRQKPAIVRTDPPAPIADLDSLPDPAGDFVFPHLALSRGCVGNCTFCGSPRFWGRQVRFHSPAYLVRQMARLHAKGVNFFHISDDTFTLRKDYVLEVCQRIREQSLSVAWAAIARADQVDAEILRAMRLAGCVQISYGVESGSEKIRKALGKRLSQEAIKRAFSLTTQHGILARAYFIYGCPGESEQTIRQSLELMEAIGPLSAIFYILDIFPGTALYQRYQEKQGLDDDIWLRRVEDILYFETDPSLSRDQVLEYGQTLRQGFYQGLPRFARAIRLKADPELYPWHADFLSRLAMTFTHGDYAGIPEIPDKEATAEGLYQKALSYHPDRRAFLGLGILSQKRGAFERSLAILKPGLARFPHDASLAVCAAVSRMNLGQFQEALQDLLPFERSPQTWPYIAQCYQALGDPARAARYRPAR